jgi:hypothetical protein
LDKVRNAAQVVASDFLRHRIGQYYKESIWDVLRDDERQALLLVGGEESGLQDAAPPRHLKEALTQIEHYGLIEREAGKLLISAKLRRRWISQREYE